MKRGDHRCYVAVRTATGTHQLSLVLAKGTRTREREDAVVGRVALLALAHACGVEATESLEDSELWRLDPDGSDDTMVDFSTSALDEERLSHVFVPLQSPGE